jgi:hypothetical protein
MSDINNSVKIQELHLSVTRDIEPVKVMFCEPAFIAYLDDADSLQSYFDKKIILMSLLFFGNIGLLIAIRIKMNYIK